MKNRILPWLFPILVVIVMVFVLGLFVGRNTQKGVYTIEAQHEPQTGISEQTQEQDKTDNTGLIDLNTADANTLMQIPGIGAVMAQRIIDYRTVCGGFVDAEQLLEVEGIAEGKLSLIREYITLEGANEDTGR